MTLIFLFPEVGQLYLMLSSVSSGIGPTVCTAGRFLLVAPLTKFDEEVAEEAGSGAPARETTFRLNFPHRDNHTSTYIQL